MEQWLKEKPEHRILAEEVEVAWEKTEHIPLPEVALNLDAEFSLLLEKIGEEDKGKDTASASAFPWMRVAAAVLVILLLGYLWNRPSPTSEWEEFSYTGENEAQTLPDGSKVWLREGASVRFMKAFGPNKRTLELTGEAFFDVAHEAERPFFINCTYGTVQVLGTTFTVNERLNRKQLEVVVVSGRVQLEIEKAQKKIVLEAKEKATWDEVGQNLVHNEKASLNEVAWHTKALQFEDTPLSEVLNILQTTYTIELDLANPALNNCPLSLVMQTEDPVEYFDVLKEVFGIEVVKSSEKSYRLEGGSCP